MLRKVFRGIFLEKEIMSKYGVLHFRRWRLLPTPLFSIYIHKIYKADEDEYMHDHPWNYFNMILHGSYTEKYFDDDMEQLKYLTPGNCGFNMATRFHKIEKLNSLVVTTLFITGRRKRDWGYKIGECWVQHAAYRQNKNAIPNHSDTFIKTDKMELTYQTALDYYKNGTECALSLLNDLESVQDSIIAENTKDKSKLFTDCMLDGKIDPNKAYDKVVRLMSLAVLRSKIKEHHL